MSESGDGSVVKPPPPPSPHGVYIDRCITLLEIIKIVPCERKQRKERKYKVFLSIYEWWKFSF